MKQTGLFDAQEREIEKKRAEEYDRYYGWSKDRAKGYKPGHPWCDPDIYPTAAEMLAAPVEFGLNAPDVFLSGAPTGDNLKHRERRRDLRKNIELALDRAVIRYEDVRTKKAEAISAFDLQLMHGREDDCVRNALATTYNHVLYELRRREALIRRWPDVI